MENYTLKDNEIILYRGETVLMPDGKTDGKNAVTSDLLLTNHNIVISIKKRKLMRTMTETFVYSLSDVKVYDEKVQVIRRKDTVDIYLKDCELFLGFAKEKEAKQFCDNAIREISGESKFVRSVKKTRKVIKETNEALDIDIVEIAKTTASVACDVTANLGTVKGAGFGTRMISSVANTLRGNSKKNKTELLTTSNSNENSDNPEECDT